MDNLKNKILKERGLVRTTTVKQGNTRGTFGRFVETPKPQINGKKKTPLMKYLENKYHVALEEILLSDSLSRVAKRLGNEVDTTTLSKWIKRFKLRYTKDNLPPCQDCGKWNIACDGGICQILMEAELWDLIDIKKNQVLKEMKEREGNQDFNQ